MQNASPFLFPCTIEYSLICAAILYVMWKNISRVHADVYRQRKAERCEDLAQITHYRKSPHYYSVDCAQAHKGLFVGILFLVLTIISLILFFVLISRENLITFAVMEVNVCELSLYGMTTMATIVGMIQVKITAELLLIIIRRYYVRFVFVANPTTRRRLFPLFGNCARPI